MGRVARSGDTDFTVERLVKRANGDLANGLGKLQNRTLALVHNYREGPISKPSGATSVGTQLGKAYQALPYLIDEALARFDFRAATGALRPVAEASNRLIETQRPWELARRDKQGEEAATQLDEVLSVLAEACRILAAEAGPFIPTGSSALSKQFRTGDGSIAPPTPIFARLEAKP